MRERRTAVAVAVAAGLLQPGCGQPRPGAEPKPGVTGGVKQVAPLGFAADAKAPAQALILGTDARGGSTLLPLVGAESAVSVDSLYIRPSGGSQIGGTGAVELVTAPNPGGVVRVGIFEEVAGSLGPQWRAGVWAAAYVAATVLNKDLTDFRFSANAGGSVDGASASGLMTAGYLASMIGLPVDPRATMTGVINPDGTIGPVSGIPQKFTAALALGKKRLGYPIGLRLAEDANGGPKVDLEALAKAGGAEAVEVADVYGAVELLTGKHVPRPVPVKEAQMALEPEVVAALEEKYGEWQQQLAQEWARLIELDSAGRVPAGLKQLGELAQAEGAAAERLRAAGHAASAYQRVVRAWVYAAGAVATSEVLMRVRANDLPGARAKLEELQALAVTTEVAVRKVGELAPSTMGQHLQLLSAFQRAIGGWGFQVFSADLLAPQTRAKLDELAKAAPFTLASTQVGDQVVEATAPTVLAIVRGVAASAMAIDALDIEGQRSISYLCSLPNVRRLSTSFQSAAGSNLAYFDALVIAEIAKLFALPPEQARTRFANIEPDYLVALMGGQLTALEGLPRTLQGEWGEQSITWGLFALASSQLSFFHSSSLISRWYSLGVQNDPLTGRASSVVHEKAFAHMLRFAELRARENARAALVATGEIPVQSRLRYAEGVVLRDGPVAEKLMALEAFWSASAFAQTAVMLARN